MRLGTRDDAPLPEPPDELLLAEDAFPPDGIETGDGEERDGLPPMRSGPLIAAATFVPTFLAVFFGLSYVLGPATPPPTSDPPAPSALPPLASDVGQRATPPLSETIRDPFVPSPPRLLDLPATSPRDPGEVGRPSDPREAPRDPPQESGAPDSTSRPAGPSAPSSEPTLPPAARAVEPGAPAESRKAGRDWAPAAAFTDREAASRLASSIQEQGYPVEIRQDRSSTRPWVVWIGAQPRSGDRRH